MNNDFFSAKEIINCIENENKLHLLCVEDIYIWGELRNYYFFKIINNSYHKKRRPDKNNLKNIKKVFKNNFSNAKHCDTVVVLGHRKSIIKEDEIGDPLTFELRSMLTSFNMLDEKPFNGSYLLKYKDNIYHNIDLLVLRKIRKYRIQKQDIEKLEKINNIFISRFPKINFEFNELLKTVNRFIIDYNYYYKALQKQKVKRIFLPSYYSHFPILLASKKLGIDTVEIQYSSINKNHINYDFSTDSEIPYLPDSIILWSRYFDKPFLKYKNKFFIDKVITKTIPEKKKKIVVISQDLIADEIHELALEISRKEELAEYEIVLKQHQWEIAVDYDGINVVDSNSNKNIVDIVSDAEIVISSFSTVIDEALQLDCKVILFDNGFTEIVDSSLMLDKISNADDLIKLFPFKNEVQIKPFDNNSEDLENLLKFLKEQE